VCWRTYAAGLWCSPRGSWLAIKRRPLQIMASARADKPATLVTFSATSDRARSHRRCSCLSSPRVPWVAPAAAAPKPLRQGPRARPRQSAAANRRGRRACLRSMSHQHPTGHCAVQRGAGSRGQHATATPPPSCPTGHAFRICRTCGHLHDAHEAARRGSPEYLDSSTVHGISREILQPDFCR
jgi:hypothetical protein